jgi:hypothetical protein
MFVGIYTIPFYIIQVVSVMPLTELLYLWWLMNYLRLLYIPAPIQVFTN